VSVVPGADAAAAVPAAQEPAAVAPVAASAQEGSYWPWVSGFLAVAWLATLALWWRSAGRGSPPAPGGVVPKAEPKPALRKILRDLGSACAVSDAAAARTALLQYGEARFASSPPRSLGALAALLPEPPAHEVLALEAHLYGAATGPWRGDGLNALCKDLESAAAAPAPPPADPLLPLYR